MRPDVAQDAAQELGVSPPAFDAILDSICQADFLWCVFAASGGRDLGEQYPSFAALYDQRTRPIVERLLTDRRISEGILPGVSEEDLKAIVGGILDLAAKESRYWI